MTVNSPGIDETVSLIRQLEARRYEAMRESDVDVLDRLLSANLIYSHSFGDRDSKSSYLDKVRRGFFRYEQVSNAEDSIVVVNRTALVAGTMSAVVTVDGFRRTLNNASLAVWSQDPEGAWLLVAYQPTPLVQPT
ncbi:nuclear transport factor 2 family protein [Mycolicibacterium mengxianglii]|uniref:nuclear transport factor 2 family protein n=1 Tax=Mycolicibacterium mengxianglii TaxID=2736649 RepID=UPI0018D1556B|nr:nuclear transport factor 2 family protein [Mycolicibacterium mengxianglii]